MSRFGNVSDVYTHKYGRKVNKNFDISRIFNILNVQIYKIRMKITIFGILIYKIRPHKTEKGPALMLILDIGTTLVDIGQKALRIVLFDNFRQFVQTVTNLVNLRGRIRIEEYFGKQEIVFA